MLVEVDRPELDAPVLPAEVVLAVGIEGSAGLEAVLEGDAGPGEREEVAHDARDHVDAGLVVVELHGAGLADETRERDIHRTVRFAGLAAVLGGEFQVAGGGAHARDRMDRQRARHRDLAGCLQVHRLGLRVDVGQTRDGREPGAPVGDGEVEFLHPERREILHRPCRSEVDRDAADIAPPRLGREIAEVRGQSELQRAAVVLGGDLQGHVDAAGGQGRSGHGPPRGELEPGDAQRIGRFAEPRGRLVPRDVHRAVQASGDERASGLFHGEVHLLDQRGLVSQVDPDLVRHVDVDDRRGAVRGDHAHAADGDAAARSHQAAELRQVDPARCAHRGLREIDPRGRTGDGEHAAVEAGDLVSDAGLLLVDVVRTAQGHAAELVRALAEREPDLGDLGRRRVRRERGAETRGILERTGRGGEVGGEAALDRLGKELVVERQVEGAARLAVELVGDRLGEPAAGGDGELAGGAVGQPVEGNVETGDVGDGASRRCAEHLGERERAVLQRDVPHVELRRSRGRRLGRVLVGFGHAVEQLGEVAGAVGLLDDGDDRRIERQLVHLDVASEDREEAVPDARLDHRGERLRPARRQFQAAQRERGERAQRDVLDRQLAAQAAADLGQDHALDEQAAREDEIEDDEDGDGTAEDQREFALLAGQQIGGHGRTTGCGWVQPVTGEKNTNQAAGNPVLAKIPRGGPRQSFLPGCVDEPREPALRPAPTDGVSAR